LGVAIGGQKGLTGYALTGGGWETRRGGRGVAEEGRNPGGEVERASSGFVGREEDDDKR